MTLVIFDLDNTLTDATQPIDSAFKSWLLNRMPFEFVVVTGSDNHSAEQQLGNDLYQLLDVYSCSGNQLFSKSIEVYSNSWTPPADLTRFLQNKLMESKWQDRATKPLSLKPGVCSFSIVGKTATQAQRQSYKEYDNLSNERVKIVKELMQEFDWLTATVAGDTSIDIHKTQWGKQQILKLLPADEALLFFGDSTDPYGNDYALAQEIVYKNLGKVYNVKNWQETWAILRSITGE